MEADFQQLATQLGATRSMVRVPQVDPRRRMGILVSQFDHCLTELLHRWEGGELDVDLTCVVRRGWRALVAAPVAHTRSALCSNHQRERNTYVSRFLERHGVPLYYIPASGPAPQGQMRSHEPAILSLVHRSDFLVLARYMQVLSGGFLDAYGRDIINIHHGLLPSFKGACPAVQRRPVGGIDMHARRRAAAQEPTRIGRRIPRASK
jgi:formyltetrahydrofolate deformylase